MDWGRRQCRRDGGAGVRPVRVGDSLLHEPPGRPAGERVGRRHPPPVRLTPLPARAARLAGAPGRRGRHLRIRRPARAPAMAVGRGARFGSVHDRRDDEHRPGIRAGRTRAARRDGGRQVGVSGPPFPIESGPSLAAVVHRVRVVLQRPSLIIGPLSSTLFRDEIICRLAEFTYGGLGGGAYLSHLDQRPATGVLPRSVRLRRLDASEYRPVDRRAFPV